MVERKAQLEMFLGLSNAASIHFVPSFDDGEALMLACMEQSLEANKDRWEKMQGR